MHSIDFVVNVSSEEGSSNVLLQSLASGIPLITYDIESNRELVIHDFNGFIVRMGNISQKSISHLL